MVKWSSPSPRVAKSLSIAFMWSGEPFSETLSVFEDIKLETFTVLPSLFAINPSCFNKY